MYVYLKRFLVLHRIEVIRADNDRLKKELRELRNAKKETESAARKTAPVEKKVPKKDSRKLPGNNT